MIKKTLIALALASALSTPTIATEKDEQLALEKLNIAVLKSLVGCYVFAVNSGEVSYAEHAQSRIDEYSDKYTGTIIYYSGKAEGFMLGTAEGVKFTNKILTIENATYIAAGTLFRANDCKYLVSINEA